MATWRLPPPAAGFCAYSTPISQLVDTIRGHLNAAFGIDFAPDGRRLISAHGGHDAVKLWDVATRQELLNLSGSGSNLRIRWSADGNVIFATRPWQIWQGPFLGRNRTGRLVQTPLDALSRAQ